MLAHRYSEVFEMIGPRPLVPEKLIRGETRVSASEEGIAEADGHELVPRLSVSRSITRILAVLSGSLCVFRGFRFGCPLRIEPPQASETRDN
jgi:hypothetical protein